MPDVYEWAEIYEDARDTIAVLVSYFPKSVNRGNNELFNALATAYDEAVRGAEEYNRQADIETSREMRSMLREYYRSVM